MFCPLIADAQSRWLAGNAKLCQPRLHGKTTIKWLTPRALLLYLTPILTCPVGPDLSSLHLPPFGHFLPQARGQCLMPSPAPSLSNYKFYFIPLSTIRVTPLHSFLHFLWSWFSSPPPPPLSLLPEVKRLWRCVTIRIGVWPVGCVCDQ